MTGGAAAAPTMNGLLPSGGSSATVVGVRLGNRVEPAGGTTGDGAPPEPAPAAAVTIRLLESFGVSAGGRGLELPPAGQRLLAFLALRGGVCPRISAATALWPGAPEELANAALRSALWRLRRGAAGVVDSTTTELALARDAAVDVATMRDLARRLVRPEAGIDAAELDASRLAGTLLPGWYDDWVLLEREQLHQLQLHGLEALAERFLGAGRHGPAADAALAAVRLDPLRESPYRLLVRVHLDEGNASEALRQYDGYRRLLWEELAVAPSPRFAELVRSLVASRSRRPDAGTRW